MIKCRCFCLVNIPGNDFGGSAPDVRGTARGLTAWGPLATVPAASASSL